jgi:hypothetical protein
MPGRRRNAGRQPYLDGPQVIWPAESGIGCYLLGPGVGLDVAGGSFGAIAPL